MSESNATVLVVQHTERGGPGRWEEWLGEAGVRLEVVRAFEGAPVPAELARDGLMVLGGGYLPDDDERAPWLAPTRALVGQALERGTPVFGICLGGQMLAQVGGGEVRGAYGSPEFGSTPLRLRAAAAQDPLFRGLPERPTAIENHVDRIVRLPAGAHWLVESDACAYQAFRLGDSAWGVQFHPESSAERIPHWDEERLARHGVDRETLHQAALDAEPAAIAVWRRVAHRFAARVRHGAP
ncbi:GMP synthase-Glutamine amidotransferase [Streptomyces sp. DvalAA-14]|uniref:type 1 glutamine amidotransferase n=1 Tax=unclassified Streptomyces TaxID=2593676 RepID=UPI00081B4EEE|nr:MULTISPECIES: type 1 glutamine amidotransferase [unclassified Streptomyces]MYS23837.1 type 1 glutamine amidotransferase [Streptomyces sp. SID4948]SCE39239.1 GMP synthase-Glutamine amidotransferase [Streptomyces sp. DvalAA-14]